MGASPSVGRNNDELVDNLIDSGHIHYRSVEFAFRVVDRGDFFPEEKRRDNAYRDQAWRSDEGDPGCIHLSAPCIYANALEHLDLKPGLSFLNIGSGTGYFSMVAGYLLTEKGVNHGVELYENLIEYAEKTVEKIITRPSASAFSACIPEFFNASAFFIHNKMQYDRIYCGALVPSNHRVYFCQMLKIGGILVMPYGSALLQIVRKDADKYFAYQISSVSFSQLISPAEGIPRTIQQCHLPAATIPPLSHLCRTAIRHYIRRSVFVRQPIQMQFEIGVTKIPEPPVEEDTMERIGTLYFMGRRNREIDVNLRNQGGRGQEIVGEEVVEHPMPPENPPVEAPDEMVRTPPMIDAARQQVVLAEEETDHQQNEQPMPEAENIEELIDRDEERELFQDGMDAEAAMLREEAHEQAQEQNEEEPPANRPMQQHFAVHVNNPDNAAQIAQRLQVRRQRLHVNLVNGNRLVGFLNNGDDEEEEDPFNGAGNHQRQDESIGLAFYDRNTIATFHLTNVPPVLDRINMLDILPNYEPPAKKHPKQHSDSQQIDVSTSTEDNRRQPRISLHLAVHPIHRDNPRDRPLFPVIRQRPNAQPQPADATINQGTQTEAELNQPNQQNQQPDRHIIARQLLRGLQQHGMALRQQRLQQLYDRMQRFENAVPQPPSRFQPALTTAGTVPSNSNAPNTSSVSTSRLSLKRKIDSDCEDTNTETRNEQDQESTSMSKMSRSVSLPNCPQEEMSTTELMSNHLIPRLQMQSQSSSLRPDSPVPSTSSAIEPSSPSSVATTVSSEASRVENGPSTSSQASDAMSDMSSVAGGSTSSVARTESTADTTASSSNFGEDQQEERRKNEKRQEERAERARVYHRQMEEFQEEFNRRLKNLPLSDRLKRFVSYEA